LAQERSHRSPDPARLADNGSADAPGGADDQDGRAVGRRHARTEARSSCLQQRQTIPSDANASQI
jgi:hypothetical protein